MVSILTSEKAEALGCFPELIQDGASCVGGHAIQTHKDWPGGAMARSPQDSLFVYQTIRYPPRQTGKP